MPKRLGRVGRLAGHQAVKKGRGISTDDTDQLCDQHEPMVSEEQWIVATTKLIKESGPETFLKHLLENLKGNYVASDAGNEHLNN